MEKKVQCIFLLIATIFNSCGLNKQEQNNEQQIDEIPVVKLTEVSTRNVSQVQEYAANVEAEAINNIVPSAPVRIDQIMVEVGDYVSAGQKLVSMDQAKLKQMELQLANKQTEFDRTDELYKIGGVSKSEWDAQKMALDVQATAYKDLQNNTVLISPINGVVTSRNYDNGDLYSGATPILVVEQISPVKLTIHVSEDNYTQVKTGDDVSIKLDVYGDKVFHGKISLVYPTIDPNTRTFPVEIKINNHDKKIRPGMFARATLNFGEKKHVVVPDIAIVKQHGAGDYYVYVYEDGKVFYNKVILGRRLGHEYELISGVPDNAQVVIAGQSKLANDIRVKVQ